MQSCGPRPGLPVSGSWRRLSAPCCCSWAEPPHMNSVTGMLHGLLSLDVRSLVALRVCVGLVVFADVVRRMDTLEFYTDKGGHIQMPGDTQHRCLFHELWFWKGTWKLQAVLFALTALASLCMSAGFGTTLANAVAWVGIVAIHGRNECVNDSSDKMLRNVLFWCLVLPLGSVGSVDRARQLRLRTGGASPHPDGWACGSGWTLLSPGTIGLLLQVCCIYLAVCWQRRFSREWWGSLAYAPYAGSADPAVDFSAVYSMLGSPFAAKGFGKLLASSVPSMLWILTLFGDLTELLAPLLLLTSTVNSWRRTLPVAALLGLQLGINLVLYLTSFGLIAGLTMVAFIPTPAWEWWQGGAGAEGAQTLRLRVDGRAVRSVDSAKKTDDEEQEWSPPLGLAMALLWSGAASGDAGGGLKFEPCDFQSVAWCVVADAASAEDADSEAELRAKLQAMSLIDLYKRAKDPHLLMIEPDVLDNALHSVDPKAALVSLLLELQLVDDGRILVGSEGLAAVLQAGGPHAGKPEELTLREMVVAWALDALSTAAADRFFCPCFTDTSRGGKQQRKADSGCFTKLWRLAERIGRLARSVGGIVALLYMLVLNGAEVGIPGVEKLDGGDVGEILRLNQNWVMYTPTPPRESGWFSVVGYAEGASDAGPAADLQAVDLMAALRTDVWEWSDDPSATIELAMAAVPPVPAELYPSSRWEKMFENYLKLVHKPGSERGWGCAAGGEKMRDARLGTMARWFCGRWDGAHSADPPGSAKLGRVVIGVA